MKWTGMLVVSLRGVYHEFWSHVGCLGRNPNIFHRPFRNGFLPRVLEFLKELSYDILSRSYNGVENRL